VASITLFVIFYFSVYLFYFIIIANGGIIPIHKCGWVGIINLGLALAFPLRVVFVWNTHTLEQWVISSMISILKIVL
jgi:hypothetical protein